MLQICFFAPEIQGSRNKLNEEHEGFLVASLGKNPSTNVDLALDQLTANFEGLNIGKSAVHNIITRYMGLTFKRVEFHSVKRMMKVQFRQDINRHGKSLFGYKLSQQLCFHL